MNINYTDVVVSLIGLLSTVVTVIVIPLIKSKLTVNQQTELAAWVKIAVEAAEQIFNGTGLGAEKKQYVIDKLKELGVNVEDERISKQIDILIESFVAQLNGKAAKTFVLSEPTK